MLIPVITQFDIAYPATNERSPVRLKELREMLDGLFADDVDVALGDNFVGTYNSTTMTLTQTTPAVLVIDGVTVMIGDRILIKAQTDQTQNGVYEVTTLGTASIPAVLTRAADFDESGHFRNNMIVPILYGTNFAETRWVTVLGAIPFVLDTTNVNFVEQIVDWSKVEEAIMLIVGDGTTSVFSANHGWDTRYIQSEMYHDVAPFPTVMGPPLTRPTVNMVQVEFPSSLPVGERYVVVLHGKVDPA